MASIDEPPVEPPAAEPPAVEPPVDAIEESVAESSAVVEHPAVAHPPDDAREPEGPADAGILDLYRAAWQSARDMLVRYRVAVVVELVLIAAWFILRTASSVESRPYLVWTIVAAGVAVISPTSGLVILASAAPFFEPVTLTRALGMRHILVAALGISVLLRLVLGGWRRMPWSPPLLLGIAIGVLTALGVVNTFRRFDQDWAMHAAGTWLASVGGAMIILVVAAWVARNGTWRPLVAAVIAAVVAGGLSLADHFAPGAISNGPLAWVGFWKDFNGRLGGVIPSPNAMAALLIVPTAVLVFWAVLGRGNVLTRVVALVVAVPMVGALYVTYSRAALLALFVIAVILTWRIRRALGVAVLAVGIVGGIILLPGYLQLRSQSAIEGTVQPGSILVASDELRFRAWGAAIGMWQNQPIVGQGFLAYKQLGDQYGDAVLGSPHNEWLRLFAEEGTTGGIVGLAFLVTTLWWLSRRREAIFGGILAGAAGYFLMASFNNPLLFVQVSAVVFAAIGYGLGRVTVTYAAAVAPADGPSPPLAPGIASPGQVGDPRT